MTPAPGSTALLSALLAALASPGGRAREDPQGGAPDARSALVPGEAVTVELGPSDPVAPGARGSSRRFELEADAAGPSTIRVRSVDGDPFVRVLDPAGRVLAADDDGGVEWNARLVWSAEAGERVRLEAGFKLERAGVLEVEVQRGDVAPPAGPALDEARARFFGARARSERARGRARAAAYDLHRAGELWYRLRRFAAAEREYAAARELEDRVDDPLFAAVVHAYLGALLQRRRDFDGGLAWLERAHGEVCVLGHAPLRMFVASHLASAYRATGRPAAALARLEESLALARELGDRANEVALLSQLGLVGGQFGDPDAARRRLEEALALAAELGLPGVESDARAAYGRFCLERAEYGPAAALLDRAQELAPTAYDRAAIGGDWARVDLALGRFVEAEAGFRRALDVGRELGDPQLVVVARAGLGVLGLHVGDAASARVELEAALGQHGAGSAEQRAQLLMNLAEACASTGDAARARAALDEALELVRGPEHAGLAARVLALSTWLQVGAGETGPALETARAQLELARATGRVELEAVALANLADLHLRRDELERAEALALEATERCRAALRFDNLIDALGVRAELAVRAGDAARAARVIDEAGELLARSGSARLDREAASFLRARERVRRLAELRQDLVALRVRDAAGDADVAVLAEGFEQAGADAGRALLEGIAEHRRGARSARALELRRELARLRADREDVLDELPRAIRGAEGEDGGAGEAESRADALRARVRELDRAIELAGERLRREAPQDASLDVSLGTSPEEARRALLPRGETLLQFAEGRERVYAYVLTADELRWADLGERAELARRVEAFVDGISSVARLAGPAAVARQGRELYRTLVGELVPPASDGVARLYVAPSETLAGLPFEALVVDAPDEPSRFAELAFLAERAELAYAPSVPVLALLTSAGDRRRDGPLLVLADPLYEQPTPGAARRSPAPRLARLPGTRDEALELARLALGDAGQRAELERLAGRRSASLVLDPVHLFVGAEARVDVLERDLRRYPVLHFAVHGLVDGDDPRRTGLALSADGDGAGRLALDRILELDLAAELVVLSACETARGELRRGEGVLSVARAFLYAGSRSVVASQWQVDDRETQAVMRAFYDAYLGRGRPPAAALREARTALLRATAAPGAFRGQGRGGPVEPAPGRATDLAGHPFFWAPFVYFGPL